MAVYSDEGINLIQRAVRKQPFEMDTAHFHSKHELYFLESGQTKYMVGSEIYMLDEGDMMFVPKNTFHKTGKGAMKASERVLIVFDDDFLGEDFGEYIDGLKSDNYIRLPREYVTTVRKLCRLIENESKSGYRDYEQMQKLYLKELLITVSRHRINGGTNNFSESFKIIQEIVKYISNNYASNITLQSLSKRYALSPSYLSRQFKSITNIGLNEYINIVRINAAEKILLTEKKSVTDVALECGFNDSNYFSAVFKKIKGTTPKKFYLQNLQR